MAFDNVCYQQPSQYEIRRAQNVIAYLREIGANLRYTSKKGMIRHTIGGSNPYEQFAGYQNQIGKETNKHVMEAYDALRGKLESHAVHFVHICNKFPMEFKNDRRAVALLDTLKLMDQAGFKYELSDELKKILMHKKLCL